MHDEIALLQLAGLTSTDALLAATTHAAEAFRLPSRGILIEGGRVDLVLAGGDPTIDASVVRRPAAIRSTAHPSNNRTR